MRRGTILTYGGVAGSGFTEWPMRALAMTGMVTAAMMALIMAGSDMRATPPSARMSAGIRSSAITAHAPARCAMIACEQFAVEVQGPDFSWLVEPYTLRERERERGGSACPRTLRDYRLPMGVRVQG